MMMVHGTSHSGASKNCPRFACQWVLSRVFEGQGAGLGVVHGVVEGAGDCF